MPLQSYTAKLIKKYLATPEIYLLTFELPSGKKLEFTAGQYLILHVPHEGEYVRRLYSIATAPSAKNFELVLKKIPNGAATTYIESMNEGDSIEFQAPAGLFTFKETGKKVIMIATNTGVAPFRSMIRDYLEKGSLPFNLHLYWGMKYFKDAYYYEEFMDIAKKDPRFTFTMGLSRDTEPHEACVPLRIDRLLTQNILPEMKDKSLYDIYICGGVAVIDTLRNMLLEKGFAKNQIFFEKFI